MSRTPLSTLLSWALVAFTIEADNEFESTTPHVTTRSRQEVAPGSLPWLTSMTTWYSCLQYVPDGGIALPELERLSLGQCRLRGSNPGMVRWGYLTVDGGVVRRTGAGTRAARTWAGLSNLVEQRWAARYGVRVVTRLRAALQSTSGATDPALPDAVPENAAGGGRLNLRTGPSARSGEGPLDLAVLLARELVARTLAYEEVSPLSLSYAANPVRALGAGPVATRDLARRTGVAKETLAVMTRWLAEQDLVAVTGTGSAKAATLTRTGRAAYAEYARAPEAADDGLRAALDPVVSGLDLTPPPGCWRATVRRPDTLPHHPVVSHRGGYPDGS